MRSEVINGNVLEILRALSPQQVQCIVTSPPYFGLRDYNMPPVSWPAMSYSPMPGLPEVHIPALSCCLGLEPDPLAFIGHMVLIFQEAHRVLKDDGIVWVNMGDSYAASTLTAHGGQRKDRDRSAMAGISRKPANGYKSKDLMGIPWGLALALQADGWYLRQDIIWSKPNPMPESVTDRCTKSHEYIFLISKNEKYFFNSNSIKEPMAASLFSRLAQDIDSQQGSHRAVGKTNGTMKAVKGKGNRKTFRGGGVYTASKSFNNSSVVEGDSAGNSENESGLRNKRSVWEIATKGFKDAHFATFPSAIPTTCLLAGSREGDLVMDLFDGSGTTREIAYRLGRNYIGTEINPEYIKLSDKRMEPFLNQLF